MFKIAVLIMTISFSLISNASASLIDSMFPYSNTNKPEVWRDQLGGFATGGSIHTRVPSTNLQLMHLDLPSFKGGCGGIDLFGGGFGYINHENLERLVKNIGTSAKSYAVMLTIKSLSSLVSDLLENLEAVARFINGQNINSCQLGASIAAGLFPKTQASQELACNSRKMSAPNTPGAHLSSYFTARYDCQTSEERMKEDNSNPSLLGTEYNLVWKALEKISNGIEQGGKAINLDIKDKEFLMSLSGTLISKTTNNVLSLEHKSTLIKNAQTLDTLIFGSESGGINLYSCDTSEKCLNPAVKPTAFEAKNSVVFQVMALLNSISEKIVRENNQETNVENSKILSEAEQFLVSSSSIPIIKIITLNTALKGHGVSVTVEDYAEAVAFDYVTNYLDSLLNFVYMALGNLEHGQNDGEKIKAFKEEIRHVKQMLSAERAKAFERLNILLSVKMRAQAIEKTVLSHFVEYRSA